MHRRGTIIGSANDSLGGSRASGELEYTVNTASDGTRVSLYISALLTGPLAQFSRSGIVEEVTDRLAELSRKISKASFLAVILPASSPRWQSGSLVWQVIFARFKRALTRVFGAVLADRKRSNRLPKITTSRASNPRRCLAKGA